MRHASAHCKGIANYFVAIGVMWALLLSSGCGNNPAAGLDGPALVPTPSTAATEPAAPVAVTTPVVLPGTLQTEVMPVVQQPTAIQESDTNNESNDGALQKAGDLFDRAKSTTGSTARDWIQDKIGGAAEASSAVAEDTVKWATDTFESLKSQGLTTANDASEWLNQDWKNMESWEYKIIAIERDNNEEIAKELNRLGKNGWECYHVSDRNSTNKFYLKKRRESYLRHLPFKDFIKLAPLIQQGTQ